MTPRETSRNGRFFWAWHFDAGGLAGPLGAPKYMERPRLENSWGNEWERSSPARLVARPGYRKFQKHPKSASAGQYKMTIVAFRNFLSHSKLNFVILASLRLCIRKYVSSRMCKSSTSTYNTNGQNYNRTTI